MTIDEIRILLKVNGAATYTHTINEVTNITNNYNNSCKSLISTLFKLVSTGMIVKWGKQCIAAASDMQKSENIINTSLSSVSDSITKWTKEQAEYFGLSQAAATKYIGSFGSLGKQFNLTEKDAASMGVELTKLTGDLSSFYGTEQQTAASRLNAVFTGDANALKDYGVIMSETQLKSYALAKGLQQPYEEMSEHDKVIVRYHYVMDKLNHVQGDFAKNSDSYANSMQNYKNSLDNLKTEVGKELIPVAVTGLQALTTVIKTISPYVVTVANTVKLYVEAWKNASEETKKFVKLAIITFGVMILAPKIFGLVQTVVKLLTMDVLTLNAALGILGVLFAGLAFYNLSKQVAKMKAATTDVDNLGESAELSSDAVDDLSASLDGLGDSSKGLDTFLASFDEVNKVGGNSSLMSSLVTAEDLDNITGASLGGEDLQKQLDSLHLPSILPEGVFTKQFWADLGEGVMGFLDEVFFDPGEFWADWKRGFDIIIEKIEDLGDWLDKVAPKWSTFWQNAGIDIHNLTHDKEGNPKAIGTAVLDALLDDSPVDKSGSFTQNGVQYAQYNPDGTLSKAYENYIRGNVNKTVNTNTTNNNNTTRTENINLLIDGQKITSVVVDGINAITRSAGQSPLYE